MSLQVFKYHETSITFNKGENVMIDATSMAKAFAKKPTHWLNTDQSKNFIATLSELRKINSDQLVYVERGGASNGGTWMHEDVALEFSRWLAPEFAIWCNDRIKELLTTGSVALSLEQQTLNVIGDLQDRVKKMQVKADHCDKVLKSGTLLTATQVAASLPGGFTANRLNEVLVELGVQYKERGVYYLYSKYKHRGYEGYDIDTVRRKDGTWKTVQLMCFTEKGRKWIAEGFARHNITPKAPKKVAASF